MNKLKAMFFSLALLNVLIFFAALEIHSGAGVICCLTAAAGYTFCGLTTKGGS